MGCGLWTVAVIAFITASLTLQTALKNGFIDLSTNTSLVNVPTTILRSPAPVYTCHYAGMWCTCFTNNHGGCSVGCSPNVYKTRYNQTSCPQLTSFILAGFNLE
jgi:hypothetical protein